MHRLRPGIRTQNYQNHWEFIWIIANQVGCDINEKSGCEKQKLISHFDHGHKRVKFLFSKIFRKL